VNLRLCDSLQPVIDADVANALQVGQANLSFAAEDIRVMRFEANMFADEEYLGEFELRPRRLRHVTGICRLRNCVRLMDSFAFVAVRRVRPPGIEAR
jgi:hypothetical protein